MRGPTAVTTTLAFALLVTLAGCLGAVGGETGASTTQTPTPPDTPTADGGGTEAPTSAPSGTPTQTYVAPTEPNRPTEVAGEGNNRIKAAKFVNRVPAQDGEGYTNFDIRMLANTSMERIDPPEVKGDVEGEPYAIVLINGTLVERTSYLEMRDRGRFTIDVRMSGFPHNDIEPGKLDVRVLLMDQDSSRDDVYGTWSGTIRYAET